MTSHPIDDHASRMMKPCGPKREIIGANVQIRKLNAEFCPEENDECQAWASAGWGQ
jgi:hypothetical protein